MAGRRVKRIRQTNHIAQLIADDKEIPLRSIYFSNLRSICHSTGVEDVRRYTYRHGNERAFRSSSALRYVVLLQQRHTIFKHQLSLESIDPRPCAAIFRSVYYPQLHREFFTSVAALLATSAASPTLGADAPRVVLTASV
jgi:hypothetical protein